MLTPSLVWAYWMRGSMATPILLHRRETWHESITGQRWATSVSYAASTTSKVYSRSDGLGRGHHLLPRRHARPSASGGRGADAAPRRPAHAAVGADARGAVVGSFWYAVG